MCEILVIADHIRGVLAGITLETIGAGTKLKEQLGIPLIVAVIAENPSDYRDQVNCVGVDQIIEISTGTAYFEPVITEEVICQLVEQRKSAIILIPHSANGMAYGPSLSVQLGSGFASDILAVEAIDGQLLATRSIYENKVQMNVSFPDKSIVTLMLRGATFELAEEGGTAEVIRFRPDLSELPRQWSHLEFIEAPESNIDIAKAEFILSIGRGIGDQEHVGRFSELADKLGATLGCSRPLADAGWLPKPHQVGLSGKLAANCKLYLALGISGAVQHLHGMKHVDTIIAVNTDPNAPIFNVAAYGVCGDVFEFADALEKTI